MTQSAPVGGWPYFDGITTKNNSPSPQNNVANETGMQPSNRHEPDMFTWCYKTQYDTIYYACYDPDLSYRDHIYIGLSADLLRCNVDVGAVIFVVNCNGYTYVVCPFVTTQINMSLWLCVSPMCVCVWLHFPVSQKHLFPIVCWCILFMMSPS